MLKPPGGGGEWGDLALHSGGLSFPPPLRRAGHQGRRSCGGIEAVEMSSK
ncbi:hypothetical protein P0O24_07030 [Methanotrichaceae archaeon M04Ac]|uniref:Uncharacterized protein n=1 Tax=Candidatus Methanocrinis alkalitolerans TaxID=3033395 RepID=A0ABT5XF35_9EURY|nr:hypothetical protein [Candidatus Methanocrinis alkalitolerans]MDF0593332.1 hypothetical protein [Candidatus Methanocrinis alkalitolerans]